NGSDQMSFLLSALVNAKAPTDAQDGSISFPAPASHHSANHFALKLGEPLAPPLVQIRERVLVQAKLVQHRGMDVAQVMRLLHRPLPPPLGRPSPPSGGPAGSGVHNRRLRGRPRRTETESSRALWRCRTPRELRFAS